MVKCLGLKKKKKPAGVCVWTRKINLSGAYRVKLCTEAKADVRNTCFRSRGFCLGLISSPCPLCLYLLCIGSPCLCPLPGSAHSCSGLRFCTVSVTIMPASGRASVVNVLVWTMCFGSTSSYWMKKCCLTYGNGLFYSTTRYCNTKYFSLQVSC